MRVNCLSGCACLHKKDQTGRYLIRAIYFAL